MAFGQMMNSAVIGAAFLACIAITPILRATAVAPQDEIPVDVKSEVGERAVAILTGATRVQAFRIHDPVPPGECAPAAAPAEKFGRYIIDEIAREQGKEFASRLAGILLDSKTYDDHHIICFSPRVAYRFWKGKESVDVLICFSCYHVCVGDKLLNMSEHGATVLEKFVDESFPKDRKNEKPAP